MTGFVFEDSGQGCRARAWAHGRAGTGDREGATSARATGWSGGPRHGHYRKAECEAAGTSPPLHTQSCPWGIRVVAHTHQECESRPRVGRDLGTDGRRMATGPAARAAPTTPRVTRRSSGVRLLRAARREGLRRRTRPRVSSVSATVFAKPTKSPPRVEFLYLMRLCVFNVRGTPGIRV